MWTFTSRMKTSSVDSSGEGASIPPPKKNVNIQERENVCAPNDLFEKKKKKKKKK